MHQMARQPDDPCRIALTDALALLDAHGCHGAACYVAMAIDSLDEAPLIVPTVLDGASVHHIHEQEAERGSSAA
jgi:hypothetical protein